MTALDGLRETWEAAPPRPWVVVVRDMIGLVLAMVCAATLSLLMWGVIP